MPSLQLLGGICVGDASDYMALLNLCKKGMGERSAKELFMGGGAIQAGTPRNWPCT